MANLTAFVTLYIHPRMSFFFRQKVGCFLRNGVLPGRLTDDSGSRGMEVLAWEGPRYTYNGQWAAIHDVYDFMEAPSRPFCKEEAVVV